MPVGPGVIWDVLKRSEISYPCKELTPDHPASSLVTILTELPILPCSTAALISVLQIPNELIQNLNTVLALKQSGYTVQQDVNEKYQYFFYTLQIIELLSHLIFHVKWYCMLSNVNHI